MNIEEMRLTKLERGTAYTEGQHDTSNGVTHALEYIATAATAKARRKFIEWMDEKCVEHDHGLPKKVTRVQCCECLDDFRGEK